jgi:hypothetical protein
VRRREVIPAHCHSSLRHFLQVAGLMPDTNAIGISDRECILSNRVPGVQASHNHCLCTGSCLGLNCMFAWCLWCQATKDHNHGHTVSLAVTRIFLPWEKPCAQGEVNHSEGKSYLFQQDACATACPHHRRPRSWANLRPQPQHRAQARPPPRPGHDRASLRRLRTSPRPAAHTRRPRPACSWCTTRSRSVAAGRRRAARARRSGRTAGRARPGHARRWHPRGR